ncbi:MAG: ABC transporter substrate-binding protein [Gammaproteobacteria bacterium]|nr:ABC transporter substrate-binding protein [Gammaproteobacteria bacterium]MBU1440354.1 ABC transporter substrate-binding protein [Gammaproteobacteria bacterium]
MMTVTTKFTRRALALLAVAAATWPALGLAQGKPPVKIGAVFSMSGPAAVFGIPERDSLNSLIKEYGGTLDGRKVDFVFCDDKTNPTEAARCVTQLINDEKVVAIIGPGTGGGILAAGPIAQRLTVPLLGPAGTVAITDKANAFYPWIFRIAPNDTAGMESLWKQIVRNGGKKVAIVYQEDAYGKFGAEFAQKLSKDLGFTVVESVGVPYTATDLTPQVTKFRNAGADAIFMQLSVTSLGASFLKAVNEVGFKVPVYANSGLAQKGFIDAAGPLGEGVRVLSIGNIPYDPTPPEKKLAEIMKKSGFTPKGWGDLLAGNGFMTVKAALAKIDGPVTGQAMRDTIETLCGFETLSMGKACFSKDNHDGWAADATVLTTIRDGAFRSDAK